MAGDAFKGNGLTASHSKHCIAIAIVGSGPAGFYCADFLSRLLPLSPVHLFERLPEPFGLLRYGVAPDHRGTKALAKLFERVMQRPQVRFFGNVDVGRDLELAALEAVYDFVVIAAGAGAGKRLPIERMPGACSMTALDFARSFNGYPEIVIPSSEKSIRYVCIVGNGNVSLDVARLLSYPNEVLKTLGIPSVPLEWHRALDIAEIHIVGRGTPAQVKFSPAELCELGNSVSFQPVVRPTDIARSADVQNESLEILSEWSSKSADSRHPIHFEFSMQPLIQTDDYLVCRHADGRIVNIRADLVIDAIGQSPACFAGVPIDAVTNTIVHDNGMLSGRTRTFVAGWSSGRQPKIPELRDEARQLAERIAHFGLPSDTLAVNEKVDRLLRKLPSDTVTWQDYCRSRLAAVS
jgi:ferredoxin--NADP+ reductase